MQIKIKWEKAYLLLIVSSLSLLVNAQGPQRRNLPLSPTAASLGLFGQVEVDYFNGLPNISMPVYNIRAGAINFPINLRYHASGVRPDLHSGWVGLNWALTCTPSINRVMVGDPDEVVVAPGWLGMTYPYGQAYLNQNAVLNRSDWSSVSAMQGYLNNFLLNGSYDIQHRPVPAPDEFVFNFLGYSGSFFLDHTNTWKFKCDAEGSLTLDNIDTTDFELPFLAGTGGMPVYKKRMFKTFVLKDGNGTKYYFGGDENSIEFSRAQVPDNIMDDYGNLTIANSWFLTKITDVNNVEINFEYEKSNSYQINYGESWDNVAYGSTSFTSTANGPGNSVTRNLINPVYLKTIVFPQGYLDFSRSVSTELPEIPGETYDGFGGYRDFHGGGFGGPLGNPQYFKLDKISLYSSSGALDKEFKFVYDAGSAKRLMLKQFKETGTGGEEAVHQFSYVQDVTKPLPAYLARELDHWGFWNGVNWFKQQLPNTTYSQSQVPSYRNSREPDFNYAVQGTLSKITYPTGGATNFTYELNDYNGLMNYYGRNYLTSFDPNAGIDYEQLSGLPRKAGGLRIKEIENTDIYTTVTSKRKFEYKNTSGQSSGVLHGLPQYSENGTFNFQNGSINYFRWLNYTIQPFGQTNGSHVTYSEVKEILPDNSYIIRKYSNQDNAAYRDKVLLTVIANSMYGSAMPYNSYERERGLLLEENQYSKQDQPVKKLVYTYNTDPARFDQFIRYVDFRIIQLNPLQNINYLMDVDQMSSTFDITQAYAYKKFYYSNKVSKIEQTLYDGAQPVTTEQQIVYNTDNNPIEKTAKTSDNKLLKTIYRYPRNYNSSVFTDDASKGIQSLQQKGVRNAPVEVIVLKSDLSGSNPMVISAELTIYKANQPVPDKVYRLKLREPIAYTTAFDSYIDGSGNFHFNSAYRKEDEMIAYNAAGNITDMVSANGLHKSYLWSDDGLMMRASADNAKSTEIYYGDFEQNDWTIGSSSLDDYDASRSHSGRFSGFINNPGPGEKVVHSNTWLNISLTQPVRYRYSGWIYSEGPDAQIFLFMKTATETGYFTYVSDVATSVTNKWVYVEGEYLVPASITRLNIRIDNNAAGKVWFDDIKVYPVSAQMTTYTVDPLKGLTSQSDVNNKFNFYEYDGMGRLRIIRNQNRDIIKTYEYNYRKQFYNTAVEQYFDKSNCPVGYSGSSVLYKVPANKHSSLISQADADAQAANDLATNGPLYANDPANGGFCMATSIYAELYYDNISPDGVYADIMIRFWADPSFTIPVTVSSYYVVYFYHEYCTGGGSGYTVMNTTTVNNVHSALLQGSATLYYPNSYWDQFCGCWAFEDCYIDYHL